MNFLAHLFLSCQDEELMIGNFIADFIRNREVGAYSKGVQQGIRLHRAIDTYTDNHPIVLEGVRRLRKDHSKYAPVVIDVYYDYLLANNWQKYSDESLEVFTARVYEQLMGQLERMPPILQKRLPLMVADNWLVQYGKLAGLSYTFSRMKSRVSKPEMLDAAPDSLMKDLQKYESEFIAFFPDIQQYVNEFCAC
ncbi:MAG: ACP phosphodiesterase [Saprospiraceae bacterium]|nr:ACP phosphodiesterase [Saprospiraceae bacterium]